MAFLHELITFLLATLAGLGVGSGGIYLLWLREGMKIDASTSVFLNLCFFIAAVLVASVIHAKQKRLDYRFLFEIILFGIPGALIGKWLSSFFSPVFLKLFLSCFLIFSGIFSLFITKKAKKPQKKADATLDKSEKKDYNDKRV